MFKKIVVDEQYSTGCKIERERWERRAVINIAEDCATSFLGLSTGAQEAIDKASKIVILRNNPVPRVCLMSDDRGRNMLRQQSVFCFIKSKGIFDIFETFNDLIIHDTNR